MLILKAHYGKESSKANYHEKRVSELHYWSSTLALNEFLVRCLSYNSFSEGI
jgi:hypothetical protein